MKVYSWVEVAAETGVSYPRIKYALQTGRITLTKCGPAYLLDDNAILAVIRYFKNKPRYSHYKEAGIQ